MNAVDYTEQVEEFPDGDVLEPVSVAHLCHAENCDELVDPTKLMCLKHWKMVPKAIQRRVLEHYRPGQCDDKRPSREWMDAARDAINVVSIVERAAKATSTPAKST